MKNRMFNGKRYKYYDTRSRKPDAERQADWLRSRGKLVRIVGDYKSGYSLYVR